MMTRSIITLFVVERFESDGDENGDCGDDDGGVVAGKLKTPMKVMTMAMVDSFTVGG